MESKCKKLLIFIDWFLPGYKAGGPIRSVANIAESLSGYFDIQIVASNIDHGETEPYAEIEPNTWIAKSGYKVMYLSADKISIGNFRQILKNTEFDTVYFNSLFSPRFTLFPLIALRLSSKKPKVVLAPRGMLGKNSLAIKSGKKKLFLKFSKLFGLYKNMTWHASTKAEEEEIRTMFGEEPKVMVAQNISLLPKLNPNKLKKEAGVVNFFFLSRISAIKNLLVMLKLLKQMKGKVRFVIIGPIEEPEYWEECKTIIAESQHLEINHLGSIPYYKLADLISEYHFLLLFTKNENYGHSIVESLANRCPVIISDQTPWRNLQQKNIGWDVPIEDQNAFLKAMEQAQQMDSEQYNQMAESARQFVINEVMDSKVVEQNKRLFE